MRGAHAKRAAQRVLYSLAHVSSHGETRVSKPRGAIVIPSVVLALVVALSIFLWSRGDLNRLICDGDCGPANVIPPRTLTSDTLPAERSRPAHRRRPRPRQAQGGRQPGTRCLGARPARRVLGGVAVERQRARVVRAGTVRPGVHDQGAHELRRAVADRPADPVRDPRRPLGRPDRAGGRRRSLSGGQAQQEGRSRHPRRPDDACRAHRGRAQEERHDEREPRLRRLAVHRPRRQPGMGVVVRQPEHRHAGQRPVGRPGRAERRTREGPGRECCAYVRAPPRGPRHHDQARARAGERRRAARQSLPRCTARPSRGSSRPSSG